MHFVLQMFILYLAIRTEISSVELSCKFTYDRENGYTCKVGNLTILKRHQRISRIIGDHLYQSDIDNRNRSHRSVQRVIMWNTTVHYLPGNLTEFFPHLRTLQVKTCGMKSLTRATEFHGLRRIYFGFNEIEHVPVNYFWHFCKLEILSLYGNRISDIPKMAFRDLISLRRLTLNSNRLQWLDSRLFDNCKNLEYVDLDNNALEIIEGGLFQNQSKLSFVSLRNNQIVSIGDDFIKGLLKIKSVLLRNNFCIDRSFPEISLDGLQRIFIQDCSPILTTTTMPPPPSTTPKRSKPKYKKKKIYNFDNCEWSTPKGHRYFWRHDDFYLCLKNCDEFKLTKINKRRSRRWLTLMSNQLFLQHTFWGSQ